MLKFLFWILLAANIVLFGFQQTYFDAPSPGKREPERLTQQYREDQVRIVSTDEINRAITKVQAITPDAPASAPSAVTAPAPNTTANEPPNATANATPSAIAGATPNTIVSAPTNIVSAGSCVEIGRFSKNEAILFEQQLATLSLNPENVRVTSVQEGSSHMVFMPPPAGQKAVNAKIAELKQKGVSSYYIIKDQSKLRGAISLGVFKTYEAASNFAASLEKSGISGLQIAPRGATVEKFIYRLDTLNDGQKKTLDTLRDKMPGQSVQPCEPASPKPA